MSRMFAAMALSLTVPASASAREDPPANIEFLVGEGAAILASGTAYPDNGTMFKELLSQAYPPACPRGPIEHGYRETVLYISQINHRGDIFSVHFAINHHRDVDADDDPCRRSRTEEVGVRHDAIVTLPRGARQDLKVETGIVIRLHRL